MERGSDRIRMLAWGAWGASLLLAAAGIWLWDVTSRPPVAADVPPPASWAFGVCMLVPSTAGAFIASRHPRNSVGWLFLLQGVGWQLAEVIAPSYRTLGLATGGLPATPVAALAADVLWVLPITATLAVFLVFPNGRLPTRRWRIVGAMLLVSAAAMVVGIVLRPGRLDTAPSVVNPLGIAGLTPTLDAISSMGNGLFVMATLGSLASLVVRYRHAGTVERLQLRWLTYAAAMVVVAWTAASVLDAVGTGMNTGDIRVVPLLALPIAAAVAIRRHGLYAIDVVISRTLVYLSLLGLVTVTYVVVVVVIGRAVGAGDGDSAVLSIAATALVAVAFAPARAGLQRLADRVVFGERATPYEVLATFTQRVSGTLPSDQTPTHMARVMAEGTGAAAAEVWVRSGDELRLAAAWPSTDPTRPAVLPVSAATAPPGLDVSHPVVLAERIQGVIGVRAGHEQLRPSVPRLLADLAHAASLALENAQLVDELRASRRRLVSAQAEERRRIERDLHDGAQQRLLEVLVSITAARQHIGDAAPSEASVHLAAATDHATRALAELRALVRGIHPAILTEQGLGAAIESLAHRSSLPVHLDVRLDGRLPASVETTAYFAISEGLANVTKHARATRVEVTMRHEAGRLHVQVADDGIGAPLGSGPILQGLRDRVAACDGTLDLSTGPGTTLLLELPCA